MSSPGTSHKILSKTAREYKKNSSRTLKPLKDPPQIEINNNYDPDNAVYRPQAMLPLAVYPKPKQLSQDQPNIDNTSSSTNLSNEYSEFERMKLKLSELTLEYDKLKTKSEVQSLHKPATRDSASQTLPETLKDQEIANLKNIIKQNDSNLIKCYNERDTLLKKVSELSNELLTLNFNKRQNDDQSQLEQQSLNKKIDELQSNLKDMSLQNEELMRLKAYHQEKISSLTVESEMKSDTQLLSMKTVLVSMLNQIKLVRSEHDSIKLYLSDHMDLQAFKHPEELILDKIRQYQLHCDNTVSNLTKQLSNEEKANAKNNRKDSNIQLSDDLNTLKLAYHLEKDLHQVSKDKLTQCNSHIIEITDMNNKYKFEIANLVVRLDKGNIKMSQTKEKLLELQEKHNLEIAAIKHSAHVKDLGRIANIREMSLEKDKLLNDLHSTRLYIYIVLTFHDVYYAV